MALAFALVGLPLIVEIWQAQRRNAAGLAAAAPAAVTYAAYILLAERGVRRRDPISLSAWGFLLAVRHTTATRAGVTAMLEPVLAIVVAWVWLGEALDVTQASGAAVTLAGISLAQTSR